MLTGRLTSLDVFRGVSLVAIILINAGNLQEFYPQLRHAEWNGWTFADLWFPFFVFIVGVAIPFAFARRIEMGYSRRKLFEKVVRRTLILFVIGLLLNGLPTFDLSTIRILGVLQRIALCYFFASIIYLTSKIRWQIVWAVALLFVYWGLMQFVPVPGIGAGVYEPGRNFAAYVDRLVLNGHIYEPTRFWDPEGIVSTIPAISTALFGVLTGHWLRSNRNTTEKTLWLFIMGNLGLFLGIVWNVLLPINKNLWTSSFVVFTAGFALLLLGFCYYFIDVKGYKRWMQPFAVLGTNALIVYTLDWIIPGSAYVYAQLSAWLGPANGAISYDIARILLLYFIAWIVFRKRIFIKA